jgi:hypothetical protein
MKPPRSFTALSENDGEFVFAAVQLICTVRVLSFSSCNTRSAAKHRLRGACRETGIALKLEVI